MRSLAEYERARTGRVSELPLISGSAVSVVSGISSVRVLRKRFKGSRLPSKIPGLFDASLVLLEGRGGGTGNAGTRGQEFPKVCEW